MKKTYPGNNRRKTAANTGANGEQSNNNRGHRHPERNRVDDEHPLSAFVVCIERIIYALWDNVLNDCSIDSPFSDWVKEEFGLAGRAESNGLLAICNISLAIVPHVDFVKVGQLAVCAGAAK